MTSLYDRQVKAAKKLEAAETKLMKTAASQRAKAEKQLAKYNEKHAKKGGNKFQQTEEEARKKAGIRTYDKDKKESLTDQIVARKDRPTFKIGSRIPFCGNKVDTIDWAKEELVTVTRELDAERGHLHEKPADSSAFIQFKTQIAAHIFRQITIHHLPLRMAGRYTEVNPDDVIFGNLGINPYQQRLRFAMGWAATLGLVILWAFPVAFVGLLSNVNQLCLKVTWLDWLCKLPVPLNGIIQVS